MNKLYIIRHGKTDWNNSGLVQGLTDTELNDEGIFQAKELASKIDLKDIDVCFCSPLKRCKKTADIIVGDKLKIIYDDLLLERSFGNYEGKKIDYNLIKIQWDYKINDNSNDIESIRDCLFRAKKFLDKIKKDYPGQSVLIISHGGFIKALHFNLVGYDENTDFLSFNPQNTTLYTYDIY